MKNTLINIWRGWEKFFFGEISYLPLGLFRVFFGATLLVMYSFRMMDWRFYFTNQGFVQTEGAGEILPEFYRPVFTWYPASDEMTFVLHLIFLGALFLLTIGFWARWAALVSFLLHLAFMQRNFSIAYGADIVATFFLFGLAFTDSARYWSVEKWLGWKEQSMHPVSVVFNTMGVRFIQIQLCIIYGYTGLEKLKGPTWWDGTAVWAVLGNQQLVTMDLMWLRNLPFVIAAMTFSTLIFEIYFPVLIWLKATRKWMLMIGLALHLSIAISVGLFFFSGVMMAAYLLFVDPNWLRDVLSGVGKKLKVEVLSRADGSVCNDG